MKAIIEPWRELMKEIDDGITHSQREGLPLQSIELDAGEWDLLIEAVETHKVPRSKFGVSLEGMKRHCETRYRRVKVYKEKTSV